MFTVLIQNEKTLQSFHQHLPLFNHFLNQDHAHRQLEVCLWHEDGQTIEEALPDLSRITDGKQWHALIVRQEDEKEPYFFHNPYDFCSNPLPLSVDEQTENPLIRLTQWLSKPLEYYDPTNIQKDEAISGYEGILPESITIVSVRNIDSLLSVPSSIRTLQQKDFVDRNGYPSYCRFVVVDRQEQGPSERMKSDLEFWSVVLMLAYNRLDSSVMSAYRLYAISCQMDRHQMAFLWSAKLNDIQETIQQIDHFLKHQSIYLEQQGDQLPDYEISSDLFKVTPLSKEVTPFSFYRSTPKKAATQAQAWHQQNEILKAKILDHYERFPEELQKKVPALQLRPGYQEEEVQALSMMALKRLQAEVEALNLRIIQEQALLPEVRFEKGDQLDQCSQKVESLLTHRMSQSQFLKWTIGLCVLCVFSMLFCGLTLFENTKGIWACLVFTLLLGLIPLGICLYAKHKEAMVIQKALENWNQRMDEQYRILQEYKTQYATWFADVLSYRRAQSYYEIALQKSNNREQIQRELEALQANLKSFYNQLQNWAKAMNLSLSLKKEVDFHSSAVQSRYFDPLFYLEEFQQKELFCFEPQNSYVCDLLKTGKQISTPFSFIQALNVEPFLQKGKTGVTYE